ncbi:MAG: hypothetical protein QOG10_3522 [Kribbellaceae bacterium]|jgi:hypothetical protein|nr:hypothetical protein [Kribbellaceae bacterium]
MTVLRIAVAVLFVLFGLGGLVSGARKGQVFDFVVAAALFGIAYAAWPRKRSSQT